MPECTGLVDGIVLNTLAVTDSGVSENEDTKPECVGSDSEAAKLLTNPTGECIGLMNEVTDCNILLLVGRRGVTEAGDMLKFAVVPSAVVGKDVTEVALLKLCGSGCN